MHGHWKTLHASQLGRIRLHLICKLEADPETGEETKLTFRFRQDLQFMDSRGSAVTRRGVSRSILTAGREITEDMMMMMMIDTE